MSDSEEKSIPSPSSEEKKDKMAEDSEDSVNTDMNGHNESDKKEDNNEKVNEVEQSDNKEEDKDSEELSQSIENKSEKTENKDDSEEEMETDSPKKTVKTPKEENKKRSHKKEETKKEESEEEEEEEDSEPKLGLLEQPVIIESGKREKKKVERLSMTEAFNTPNQPKDIDIPEGKGEKLGDIPRVEFQINKFKAEDLKALHRILFGKVVAATKVKKNLRQFNGFDFKKGDKEFAKRRDMLLHRNFHMPMMKNICEVLDLEKKGTKEEVADRIIEFCLSPKSSGKKVPESKKRKRSESKGKGEKKTKKEKSSKKKKSKEKVKGSDEEDEEEDKSEEEEEEEKSEEEESEEVESEPEEAPKKKKAKKETPAKKPAKKETKKKEKPAPKKKKETSEEEEEESSDDEEPLAKKTAGPPTNDELKKLIKKILDGANLEQVTMKTVVKQVYDKYPTFDLSDRKQFIKSTVKQFLS